MAATIHECILYALRNDVNVASLAGDRHYLAVIDQESAFPCTVTTLIGDRPQHVCAAPASITEAQVQVSSFAKSFGDAKYLAMGVRALLDSFAGLLGPTGNQITVGACLLEHEADMYEGDSKTFHIAQEYRVIYSL